MRPSTPRAQTLTILASIAALTILAWAYLVHLDRQMSAAMADDIMMANMGMAVLSGPWTTADVFFTFGMWVAMMVGMMAPSAAPVLLIAAKAGSHKGGASSLMPVFFGAGYLVVWIGFSAIATLAQWALHDAAFLLPTMTVASPRIAGLILIGAGLYQLTPLKHACLTHCRSPLDFLMAHWRSGLAGAFRIGAHHGAYCLGCCWALMAVLFVVGVMNLVWVGAIAVFVLLEKTVPAAVFVSRTAGAIMIVVGLIRLMLNA